MDFDYFGNFNIPGAKIQSFRSKKPTLSEFNGNMNFRNKFIVTTLLQDSAVSIRILILYPQISTDGRGCLVARLPSNIAELPAELLQPKTMDLNQISISFTTRPKPAYSRQGLHLIVGPEYSFRVFSTDLFD